MIYACVTYYSLHPHDEYMCAFMIIDAFIVHHPGGVGTWSSRVSSMMLLFNKGYSSRARDVACHNIDQSQRDIDIASKICVCVCVCVCVYPIQYKLRSKHIHIL